MGLSIDSIGRVALELTVHGKLGAEDYERFVELAESRIDQFGEIALLVNVTEFEGWTPRAFWQDLKFDVQHYRDVSRLALVAEDSSKRWMATLSSPFTGAEVRYFTRAHLDEARAWVLGDELRDPARPTPEPRLH